MSPAAQGPLQLKGRVVPLVQQTGRGGGGTIFVLSWTEVTELVVLGPPPTDQKICPFF